MIAAWMVYAVVVSALLSAAATAADRALHLYRKPGRWAWVAALAGSAALPAVALLGPEGGVAGVLPVLPPLPDGDALAGVASAVGGRDAGGSGGVGLASLLAAGWGAATAGVLFFLARSHRSLAERLSRWPVRRVGGVCVYRSDATGPAVLASVGPARVVLPRWIREVTPHVRRLALEHEREHLRAGDPHLLAGAYLLVALLPWNVPLWWQLRRLRLAVEMDCDRRVLNRGAPARSYGETLLEVGRRRSPPAWSLAALSEPFSFLQRRIENMSDRNPNGRFPRAAAAALAAVAAAALACEAPAPDRSGEEAPLTEAPASEVAESSERPTFVPYEQPPELINPREAREALQRLYPEELKAKEEGGEVTLWMYVDSDGTVTEIRVHESSGHPALDAAAREVARVMRFEPARQEDEPTAVWVQQNVVFEPDPA